MSRRFNPFIKHPPLRCHPSADQVREATILEIGPGRGDFLFELARQNPQTIVATVEIKRKRYEKLKPRLRRLALENVVLINGDARVALPALFHPQQLESCFILFSDPWPKDKHEKHRLFQPYFVHELARVMKPGGEVVIAHDDARYLTEVRRLFEINPLFFKNPVVGADPSVRPQVATNAGAHIGAPLLFQTFYATKWQDEGRTLRSCRYTLNEIAETDFERAARDSGWAEFAEWHSKIGITSDP